MNLYKIPGLNKGNVVAAEEIIRVQALSNYSRIYFANGKIATVAKVLHWFQDELPVDMFARVHRSHLVNRMYVSAIKGQRNKSLLLLNGERIAISRRRQMVFSESYRNLYALVSLQC